jgi:hypothetical protein
VITWIAREIWVVWVLLGEEHTAED